MSQLHKITASITNHEQVEVIVNYINVHMKGKVSLRIEMSGSIASRRAPPSLEAADRAVTADNPIE